MVKTMAFSVVMYRCETWIIKKTKHQRIDAFELEKTLESPLDRQRDQTQSILKEINPEYSLEGLMLKLKLKYVGPLMEERLIRKDPDVGKD